MPWLFHLQLGDRVLDVLSYGSEWVLEVHPDEHSWQGNHTVAETFGAVTLTSAGPLLYIRESDHTLGVSVNFAKNAIDYDTPGGLPTLNWRIWASEEDRLRANSAPLFVCAATPGGATKIEE